MWMANEPNSTAKSESWPILAAAAAIIAGAVGLIWWASTGEFDRIVDEALNRPLGSWHTGEALVAVAVIAMIFGVAWRRK
jgi:hypothetical protein